MRKTASQGGKVVTCVRCSGDIQPYAGREVATNRYAHHPGQCKDAGERDQVVRQLAGQQSFAWRCDHIEPGAALGPRICAELGSDRDAYAAHVKTHGAQDVRGTFTPVKVRKRAPGASLPKLEVPVFKQLRWTESHTPEATCSCGHVTRRHQALHGLTDVTYKCRECACESDGDTFTHYETQTAERRGQFWSEADGPHNVWVIPLEPAPWETGRAAAVRLYVIEAGRYTTDWSEAKYARREVNRVAKMRKGIAA